MARVGRHRVTLRNLLIAAVAEVSDSTVINYDRGAKVTLQPCE